MVSASARGLLCGQLQKAPTPTRWPRAGSEEGCLTGLEQEWGQYGSPGPASVREAQTLAAVGGQHSCLDLPEELGRGHGAACLPGPASQSEPRPFSGPGQDPGPLPNAHTFLAFLQSLSSCCRAFFPVLIYSLLFLKYTQRPLAPATSGTSSPGPKYTSTRFSESRANLLG